MQQRPSPSVQQIRESLPTTLLFLLFLLVFSLPAAEPKLDLRFQRFGTDQGLSDNRVISIFQDRQGYLWIATHYGLDRYDGYSFTHYRNRPGDPGSLANKFVIAMHDDALGRLWIATEFNLDCLDPLTGRISHLLSKDPLVGNVITLEETQKGEMWAGTHIGRIIRFEIASGRQLPLPKSLAAALCPSTYYIWQILEDISGQIWIGTRCGLFRYSPAADTLTRFRSTNDSFCQDESGRIWILARSKLDCFDPRTGSLRHFPAPKENARFISICLLADQAHRLWIGSISGIRLFDGSLGRYLDLKSHPYDPVDPLQILTSSMCEDAAGNIWIGTQGGGLFKFNSRLNHFIHIGDQTATRPGLADPWVNAICQDRSGMVWIGTRYGGLRGYDPSLGAFSQNGNYLPKATSIAPFPNAVEALCEDSSGNFWVGSMGRLFLLDRSHDRLQYFPLVPANPSAKAQMPRRIFSIVEDSPDRLWIGDMGDGLFQVDTKQRTIVPVSFVESASENSLTITDLLRDHNGCLWISTYDGLHFLSPQDGRISHYYADPHMVGSLSGNYLTSLLEDRNGNLWIGSDQGLNLMDRRTGTFRVYNEKQGLGGNYIYEMSEDADGLIWVGTKNGLSRFDPKSEAFRNYGASDGMDIGGVYTISRGIDGKILCGGYQGATIFDPREVTAINTHVPPVVVTALRVGNHPVPLHEVFSQPDQVKNAGRLILQPEDNDLSIEFAALDFTAPEKNRYAYRMGEGSTWIDLGTNHILSFAHLDHGEYALHIKGSNNDGVWNEAGVMLRIIVLPHFWQTWWFRLLVLLGLALLSWGWSICAGASWPCGAWPSRPTSTTSAASTTSPGASGRCCAWSSRASPTATSRRPCSSPFPR